jgi:hypothetical protein
MSKYKPRKIKTRRVGKARCERWGDLRVCVEGGRYGYSGWLYAKSGAGRIPVGVGAARTPTEAMRNAKASLARARKR